MNLESLPQFPNFEKIGLKHQEDIEEFTNRFYPYSDYNFSSLYSWNINENFQVSNLNHNLVVIFEDYHSSDLFIGCIGNNFSIWEIQALINKSKELGFGNFLKLIPEEVICESIKNNFNVEEDLSNNDYILSVESLLTYSGSKLRNKKSQLNRFLKTYKDIEVKNLDPFREDSFNICEDLLKVCHNKTSDFFEDEKNIITKCLTCEKLDINLLGVFVEGKICSFCIYEKDNNYLTIHFEKFNTEYEGINAFSKRELAKMAIEKDCKYINWEQDLGLSQLREAKKQFRPVSYLKKYIIKSK